MRVLVADDHENVRSALRLLLEQEQSVEVVAEAADTVGLLAAAEQTEPDIILLDWELPGVPAPQLLYLLRFVLPEAIIVALSGRPEARTAAGEAGVDAFVSKAASAEEVRAAIYQPAALSSLPASMSRDLFDSSSARPL